MDTWYVWIIVGMIQVSVLAVSHFIVRDKYLNYWAAGLIGVSTWLVPLLIAALVLNWDPRPILLFAAAGMAMFAGTGLEAMVRRGRVLSVMFHTLLVLSIGLGPGILIVWLAAVPVGGHWVDLLVISSASAIVCGVATVALHYNDMVSGLDIYRYNGLTPGEHRTIDDAVYILERKLQPRIGNAMAQIKRATEQMQASLAGMNSANSLLGLVVMMLRAISEGDETYIAALAQTVESDNGFNSTKVST